MEVLLGCVLQRFRYSIKGKSMRRKIYILCILLSSLLNISCADNSSELTSVKKKDVSFSNPQKVSIIGYSGDAMEPYISRDGNTLFFNNLNSSILPDGSENDTNLHFANRIDDVTFQYVGEVIGANTNNVSAVNELEAVASVDKNNKFYFVNTTDYLDINSSNYLMSLFEADYVNGSLVNIKSLPNLKSDRSSAQTPVIGELNFDAEIHYDGVNLYYVEGLFSGKPLPDAANIAVAIKENGIFVVSPDSRTQFDLINTQSLEYAPSISTDQLELYFTRAVKLTTGDFDFAIYVALRNSVSEPWGNVKQLDVTNGTISEGPSISFDGRLLYYHQKISNRYVIYVAKRN